MPNYYPERDYPMETEPKRRFYPNQGMQSQPLIPSAPIPTVAPQTHSLPQGSRKRDPSLQKKDDASYFMHRHPILLQRLYASADNLLASYRARDFIYDSYPDYESLRFMRERLLRENASLTEEFLQSGCPSEWLNLLTDTVLSDLLCRRRCSYRNPNGDANTTSVRFTSLS